MWEINPCVKAESRQEGRVMSGRPLLNKRHERIHPKDDGGWNKLFPILIHRSLFPAFVKFTHALLPSSSCLSFGHCFGCDGMHCSSVLYIKKMGCGVHKMNALAHQCGENTVGVRMGCDGERKGVKYCNYHPIDFQWRDRENKCYSVNVHSTWRRGGEESSSSKKGGESGEEEERAASFSSLYIFFCISSGICSFMERFYRPEQINSKASLHCFRFHFKSILTLFFIKTQLKK